MKYFKSLIHRKLILNSQLSTLNSPGGQTLVTLLFFMVVATTITAAAAGVVISNSLSSSKLQEGNIAYVAAESGIENALIRLLRDPNYAGENLTVGTGTALVAVNQSGGIYTITSVGSVNNFIRKIQAVASYNNTLAITSWKEVY